MYTNNTIIPGTRHLHRVAMGLARRWVIAVISLAHLAVPTAAYTYTYLGDTVNSATWRSIHDAAVTEIVAYANETADCAVFVSTTYATGGGSPPGGATTSFQIAPASRLGVFLPRVVQAEADAHSACYRLWQCADVHLFTVPGLAGAMLAVFFATWTSPLIALDAASGSPADVDDVGALVAAGRWVASAHINRTAGYACPGNATAIDATFLYDTYLTVHNPALVAAGIVTRPDTFGLPPIGADEAAIAAAAALVEVMYQTSWHRYRLWPSATCALTPLLRDPRAGCIAARCPLFTVCPAGFRTQSVAWGTCFPSTTSGGVVELLVPDVPTSFSLATGTVVFPGNPPLTMSAFQTVDVGRVLTTLPCGASVGAGWCAHYTVSTGVVTDTPVCACASAAAGTGVVGDYGCQFQNALCVTTPETGAVCNGRGVCAFQRDAIQWYVPDLSTRAAGAVACSCAPPWTGATCNASLCANATTGADCHVDGTGTCGLITSRSNGTSGPGVATWGCSCTFPRYGPSCEFEDTLRSSSEAEALVATTAVGSRLTGTPETYHCYTDTATIQSPPEDTDATWLLCSGRGTCTRRVPGDPSSASCTCDAGWTGPSCEYAACDHATTCGPYGRCMFAVSPAGRASTTCVCAVHEANPSIAIAGKRSWLGTAAEAALTRCDISKCLQGTLIITNTLPDWDFRTQMVGRCACFSAAFPLTEGTLPPTVNTVDLDGVEYTLPWPRHVFLPTLVEPNASYSSVNMAVTGYTPFAFIPSVQLSNSGVLCDVASCPRYLQPWSGNAVPGWHPCATDATTSQSVCLPCASHPGAGMCAFTSGFGGYCDCEGGLAPVGSTPYYVRPFATRARFPDHGSDPMCKPYCRNGGLWSPAQARCLCGNTGFEGPTCETPTCPHGTWTPEAVGDGRCTVCNLGWSLFTSCTSCATGYIGPNCDVCDTGFFRDGGTGRCVSCASAATGVCTFPGSSTVTCTTSGPVCVCNPGYTHPASGCSRCATGYTQFRSPYTGAITCEPCATVAGCVAANTLAATCTNGTAPACVCKAAGMDAVCGACAGNGVLDVTGTQCVSCFTHLGCYQPLLATVAATCNKRTPSRNACVCNTTAGYAGTTCATCAPGWTRAVDGIRCARCDTVVSCGPWGTPDCSGATPTCHCTHGFSGPTCSTCTGCGPGGSCNTDPTPGAQWCTCATGYSRGSTTGLTLSQALALPCSSCDAAGWIPSPATGICASVATVCGTSVGLDTVATLARANGTCVCHNGFTGASCSTCVAGAAGPLCLPCPPISPDAATSTCAWDPVTLRTAWSCQPGFIGANCSTCAPGFAGPSCVPCPDCGIGGVCTWTLSGVTCTCVDGYAHTDEANVTSPCSACSTQRSPTTCSRCPPCGYGRLCTEPTADSAPWGICACADGTRTLAHVTDGPSVACFAASRAAVLDAACAGDMACAALLSGVAIVGPVPTVPGTSFLPVEATAVSATPFIVAMTLLVGMTTGVVVFMWRASPS
jgi:hypothetical protein